MIAPIAGRFAPHRLGAPLDNGTLAINHSNTFTLSPGVSGSGGFAQIGNSYLNPRDCGCLPAERRDRGYRSECE